MLKDLKELLQRRHWDALVIPRRDLWGGYDHGTRLKHLIGFSGSAGTVIIEPNKVSLYTDQRYTLQAQQETTDVCISSDPWESALRAGMTLAMDFSLHSVTEIRCLQKITRVVDDDGAIASYCPKIIFPKGAVFDINSEAFQERCQKIWPKGLNQALILCQSEDIAWLSGLRGCDDPYIPLFPCQALLMWDGVFHLRIHTDLERSIACRNECITFTNQPLDSNTQTYFDASKTPYSLYQDGWQEFSLDALALCKSQKTFAEQKAIEEAHVKDGIALCRFLYWLSQLSAHNSGVNEWQAAEHLAHLRQKEKTYFGASFPTISAFGPHAAVVHYRPCENTSLPLAQGIYLVDSGGQYYDPDAAVQNCCGTTDVTRTVWIGSEPSDRYRTMYTAVLQGHIQIASSIFPRSTQGVQLDALARAFVWQQGCDYGHSTGHGVGFFLNVHEYPPMLSSRADKLCLQEGMVVSIEPGFYEENWGGIRLENLALVQSCAKFMLNFQTLTLAPFDVRSILIDQLSAAQKCWLNKYHSTVYQRLAPWLESEVQQWLHQQTQPI